MITKLTGISNGNVAVIYQELFDTIIVQNNWTGNFKCYDGPCNMKELFDDFVASFSEYVKYKDAIQYFSMFNMGNLI